MFCQRRKKTPYRHLASITGRNTRNIKCHPSPSPLLTEQRMTNWDWILKKHSQSKIQDLTWTAVSRTWALDTYHNIINPHTLYTRQPLTRFIILHSNNHKSKLHSTPSHLTHPTEPSIVILFTNNLPVSTSMYAWEMPSHQMEHQIYHLILL